MSKDSNIWNFIKTSGIFFVGSILSKLITILLLPLYTHMIPTGDMGYYDVSLTYVTILTSILYFDIWVSILRYMYDGKNSSEKALIIKSGAVVFIGSTFVYLFGTIFISFLIPIKSAVWIILYGFTQNISLLFTFCSRGFGKNKEFAISGVVNTFVNVLMNVVLILFVGMDYNALYISAILGFISQTVYLSIKTEVLDAIIKGNVAFTMTKSIFFYSIPLCVNSLAYWVLSSYNRILINNIYGNSVSGIFAIGNKFSFVISLATTCFTYAWQDLSFSRASKNQFDGEFYSKGCSVYTEVLLFFTCLTLPVIKITFPLLVGSNYSAAEDTVPLFLISAMVMAVSTFIGNVFYAIKDTKTIFISMVISAALNLYIGTSLIEMYGINGANLAIVLSFLCNIIIRSIVLKKKIGFYLKKSILLLIGLVLGTIYVYKQFDLLCNLIALLFIFIITLIYFKKYIKSFFIKIRRK